MRWKPASELEIRRFERAHGIKLPASYREFMLRRGGGVPKPNCVMDEAGNLLAFVGTIYALTDGNMATQLFAFPPPRETGFLTIASDDGGDYFLLELRTGEVFYWDHEENDVIPQRSEMLRLGPNFGGVVDALTYPPGEGPEELDEIERIGKSGTADDVDEFVRRRGLDARNASGRSVVEEAARYKNLPVLERCLDLGASTHNLLHLGAQGRNLDVIRLLLQRGAAINETDDRGQTPLDRAIFREAYDFLESLGAVHAKRSKPPHLC
jgi:hypothetical protein